MRINAPGLTAWLAIVTVILVSVAVSAVSIAAIGSLRSLAATEALTRAEFAVAAARENLRQSTEDLLTAARVLSERPTLQRLLGTQASDAIGPYLARYCDAAALDACGVQQADDLLAASGQGFDWPLILASAEEQGERFLVAGSAHGPPLIGAASGVPLPSGARVLVMRRLDADFAVLLGERAGLEIRLLGLSDYPAGSGAFSDLDAAALAGLAPRAGYIDALDVYAASVPVAAVTGEPVALLRALVPGAEVRALLAGTTWRTLAIAIAVAILAAISGILIGRPWIGGVERLTVAARRIGAGELQTPVAREHGRELGTLAATMERMRQSLIELEAARHTRDSVLANISHEFRTPLAAQLASIELLHDGLGQMQPAQQRELVESLQRGAQRLTRLIDNLLESVRIDSGQSAIRCQQVAIPEVIDAARDLLDPLLRQRQQTLQLELAADVPEIEGDHQRLVQVIVNLLANASKFGPAGGTIRLGAARGQPGWISIWVDDEGPGPSAGDAAVLFQRFRRADAGDPAPSGLGLGLYIVRSIVERHGGRVTLGRTAEGRTRASVELPSSRTIDPPGATSSGRPGDRSE